MSTPNTNTKISKSKLPGSESCNPMQSGFDFGGDDAPLVLELAPGTWEGRVLRTKAQHLAAFELARATVLGVVGPSRAMFEECLASEFAVFEDQLQRCPRGDSEAYELWGARPEFSVEQEAAFMAHCVAHSGHEYDGIAYKVRERTTMKTGAMYVPGLGTLVVRDWFERGSGVSFELASKGTEFLESYEDSSVEHEVPYSVWARAVCCQKLAEAGDQVPTVPTFAAAGREYVATSSCARGSLRECTAWALVPISDWHTSTFTYRSHIAAYDAGTVERGDHRGLVVKVRGALCVLASAARIFDASGANLVLPVDDEEEGSDSLFADDEFVEDMESALEEVAA